MCFYLDSCVACKPIGLLLHLTDINYIYIYIYIYIYTHTSVKYLCHFDCILTGGKFIEHTFVRQTERSNKSPTTVLRYLVIFEDGVNLTSPEDLGFTIVAIVILEQVWYFDAYMNMKHIKWKVKYHVFSSFSSN